VSGRPALRALLVVLAAVAVVAAVLAVEVGVVLSRDYLDGRDAPEVDAVYGDGGDPGVLLLVLGDSTAAGVGAREPAETVAGGVAAAVAAEGRRVTVRAVAVSGGRTGDLDGQVEAALAVPRDPDDEALALVLIGANDATHLSSLSGVREDLGDAVARLRDADLDVVVGTCPDLGSLPAFPQPLRALAGARGRAVAAAQAEVVPEAGGRVVDLAAETGPAFADHPDRYYSEDDFHPGPAGYALWSEAITPVARQALERRSVAPG
jgi:lysophospholipase L1-like esterase